MVTFIPKKSTCCLLFLPFMPVRLLLLLVATIVFAAPLHPDAEFVGQASDQGNFPALDGDVYYGSADSALTTNNYLDTSAVNPGSARTAKSEDEIPEAQFQKFQKAECGGENSVCCMGDWTYFSSGVGTGWPCSMSIETCFTNTYHSSFINISMLSRESCARCREWVCSIVFRLTLGELLPCARIFFYLRRIKGGSPKSLLLWKREDLYDLTNQIW